jgi:hypothetical protein
VVLDGFGKDCLYPIARLNIGRKTPRKKMRKTTIPTIEATIFHPAYSLIPSLRV